MTTRAIDESVVNANETTYRLRTGRLLRVEHRNLGDALEAALEENRANVEERKRAREAGEPLPPRHDYDAVAGEIVLDTLAIQGVGRMFTVEDADGKVLSEFKISDATRDELASWVDAWVPDACLAVLGFAMREARAGNGVGRGEYRASSPPSQSRTSDAETATTA